MKLLMAAFLVSTFTYATDNAEMMKKLKAMEARIKELESKNSQNSNNTLKVEDMGNKEADSNESTADSSSSGSGAMPISDAKKKEIMDTINKYKERKAEEVKILEELDREDP